MEAATAGLCPLPPTAAVGQARLCRAGSARLIHRLQRSLGLPYQLRPVNVSTGIGTALNTPPMQERCPSHGCRWPALGWRARPTSNRVTVSRPAAAQAREGTVFPAGSGGIPAGQAGVSSGVRWRTDWDSKIERISGSCRVNAVATTVLNGRPAVVTADDDGRRGCGTWPPVNRSATISSTPIVGGGHSGAGRPPDRRHRGRGPVRGASMIGFRRRAIAFGNPELYDRRLRKASDL